MALTANGAGRTAGSPGESGWGGGGRGSVPGRECPHLDVVIPVCLGYAQFIKSIFPFNNKLILVCFILTFLLDEL